MLIVTQTKMTLSKKDVHIWISDLNSETSDPSAYKCLLSPAEVQKAQNLRFSEDRNRYLWGRIQLRQLLGFYLDREPDSIRLSSTPYGKPYLTRKEGIHFNISHSGDLLIIGLSAGDPIGVDVEKLNRNVDVDSVSRNYYSESEFRTIMDADYDDKRNLFFKIWTRKESLIKGIGKGLGISLQSFSVDQEDPKVKWDMPANETGSDWYVSDLDVKSGYRAAFATPKQDFSLSCFSMNN
ncbi:4'-phosphopantetheinyl transferase family protein [Balneola sp. MJW-20]|uniref:4'-phosphopantetheinyl transferase family protein n=1 Tax=Gracilimonas aurantiaca TaxID=3234185 RepID=UPI0034667CB3